MELDTLLTGVRILLHLGIFVLISSYHPHGSRHRWGVSALATVMAACNAGLGVALLTGAVAPRSLGGQWLNIGAFGSLFWLIVLCRGNVAKMMPKKART